MPTPKYTQEEVNQWDEKEVTKWLLNCKLDYLVEEFKSIQIDGQRLLLLSWDEFKMMESLKDEKKKKAFKKALSGLPGANFSSSKSKGGNKKFGLGGGGKKTKQQSTPPNPAPSYFRRSLSPDFPADAPALPPRPPKPGQQDPTPPPPSNYPPPAYQPHISQQHIPPPTILSRPPINAGAYPQGGVSRMDEYQHESEDIYDAVPEEDYSGQPDPTSCYNPNQSIDEEIYEEGEPLQDSFDSDDGEEMYEEQDQILHSIQQQQSDLSGGKQFLTLQAQFRAHGLGGASFTSQPEGEDDEIYDLPEDMREGVGNFPPPPPPDEPPPMGDELDEDIYDEGLDPPPPPSAPPTGNNFGYQDDEEIYDIADPEDLPVPTQVGPYPPPPPPDDEIAIDEEIYDTMDAEEEPPFQHPLPLRNQMDGLPLPPLPTKPTLGGVSPPGGMKPLMMRPPIRPDTSSNVAPPPAPPPAIGPMPVLRPPIESNAPPPAMPSRTTKPTHTQQTGQTGQTGQGPPPPPPPAPPPAIVNASTKEEKEEEMADGGGSDLASQLANMKKKLRSGSNASSSSSSSSPTIVSKNVHVSSNKLPQPQPRASPQPQSSGGMGGDLASSIMAARKKLRGGNSPVAAKKIENSVSPRSTSPSLPMILKPSDLKKGGGVNKQRSIPEPDPQPAIEVTPKPSNELAKPDKPTIGKKPSLGPKPTPAPKSNRISGLMKNFQNPARQEESPVTSPERKSPYAPDRSPMTGRKIERKSSVKELTERYNSPPPPEVEPIPSKSIPPPVNVFKRRDIDQQPKTQPPLPRKPPVETRPQSSTSPSSSSPVSPSPSPELLPPSQPQTKNLPSPRNFPPPATRPPTAPPNDTSHPFLPPKPGLGFGNSIPLLPNKPESLSSRKQPELPSRSQPPDVPSTIPPEPPNLPDPHDKHPPELPGRGPPAIPGRGPPQLPTSNKAPSDLPHMDPPVLQGRNPPELPGRGPPQLPNKAPSNLPDTIPPPLPGRGPPELPGRLPPQLPNKTPSNTDPPMLPGRGPPELPGRGPPQLPSRSSLSDPTNKAPPELPNRGPPQLPDRNVPELLGRNLPSEGPPNLPPPSYSELQESEAPDHSSGSFPPQLPMRPPLISKATLIDQSWYHKGLSREQATTKIKRYQKDGTFIVRDNTKNPGEYSLSLWHGGGIRHLKIRKRRDGQFVLGEEKPDELPFESVIALIQYHKQEPLVLKSGGQTVLKFECPHT